MLEYLSGKLVEIEEALAELDIEPDALERHAERERLVAWGAQLMAAMARYSEQEPRMS